VRGSSHNIAGQSVVEGIWHNFNLYITGKPLPDFNITNARLTYESPRELRGRETLQPSSQVRGSEISSTLAGPSGTQSITSQIKPPVPEDFQISGQGAWGVYKDDGD
jgi:hypothetical protein